MKVYTFILLIGILNVFMPFLGFPTVVKMYVYSSMGIIGIIYGLIIRTIQKEKENGLIQPEPIKKEEIIPEQNSYTYVKKIEEVVDMNEALPEKKKKSEPQPKKRGRKPKVLVE